MDILQKIGSNIRYYRKLANLTQEELASRTGYSGKASIAKIETGASDLSQTKIKAIADTLGVKVSQLFDEEHSDNDYDVQIINSLKSLDTKAQMLVLFALGLDSGMDEFIEYLNQHKDSEEE